MITLAVHEVLAALADENRRNILLKLKKGKISSGDLAAALNVTRIETAEQFEGLTRTDKESNKKKLLGLVGNLRDYSRGSTRGGEITRFNQFDIDFNQEKYLLETRVSGALTRVYSAIALEEPVA